jgi:hypothetical protein
MRFASWRATVAALAAAGALTAAPAAGRPPRTADSSLVGVTASLAFHSDFWLNLHHVLYAAAWDRPPAVTGPRRLAGASVPLDGELTPAERTAWDSAVDVYARAYRSRDLLFDTGMMDIKMALGRAGADLGSAPIPDDLRGALSAAAPVYRRHWWPAHDRANRAWIAQARRHLGALAPVVTPRLAALFRTPWPAAGTVRVDAVRVGNRQGAYTSTGPGWIVVSTSDPDIQDWAAAEILFHETSHLLIDPVSRAIDAAAAGAHVDVPGVLWHVVLFYVAGEVTRQALADRGVTYSPYLEKTGLFDRAWPSLRRPVEMVLPDFIAGRISLEEMARRLVAAVRF